MTARNVVFLVFFICIPYGYSQTITTTFYNLTTATSSCWVESSGNYCPGDSTTAACGGANSNTTPADVYNGKLTVPTTATIQAIQLQITRRLASGNGINWVSLGLIYQGVMYATTPSSAVWTSTSQTETYTTFSKASWLPAEVNDQSFGVRWQVYLNGTPGIALISCIQVSVTYGFPSPSVTPSITPSNSPTPSVTPSLTPTPTCTPSVTPTPTVTPSSSVTPSPSVTPSSTPTPSQTPTPSTTPTASVSPTPSRTSTPSRTPSNSITPSPSLGSSPSSTPSVTPSQTPTPSNSPTSSVTPSGTPTPSITPSPSVTSTPSTSPTQSVTPTSSTTPASSTSPSFTPSSSPEAGNSKKKKSSDNSVGIIVGAACGAFVLAAAVILAVVVIRRRTRKDPQEKTDVELNPAPQTPEPLPGTTTTYIPIHTSSSEMNSGSKLAIKKDSDYSIQYSELVLEKEIGRGSYGVVYKGKWRSSTVAVKKMIMDKMDLKAMQDFIQEMILMKALRPSPYIVLLLGICQEPLCVVTEFCEGGSLLSLLNSNAVLEWPLIKKIITGIAKGMLHLHLEGIVHRDLAARNVLLTANYDPKISDFGMSRFVSNETSSAKTNNDVGPVKWMAPECLREMQYSKASDVWAFGITLVEIFTRDEPYGSMELMRVATKVANRELVPTIPQNVPVKLATLMNSFFAYDPESRPDFQRICDELDMLE